jgi:hypothetical protein
MQLARQGKWLRATYHQGTRCPISPFRHHTRQNIRGFGGKKDGASTKLALPDSWLGLIAETPIGIRAKMSVEAVARSSLSPNPDISSAEGRLWWGSFGGGMEGV